MYQAYNAMIAKEAVALQNFGNSFNLDRMTWILPPFIQILHLPSPMSVHNFTYHFLYAIYNNLYLAFKL